MLVEAVPELVHGGEDALVAVVEVPRGQADVGRARPARERVDGRVEPPGVGAEPEPLEHDLLELLLPVEREVAVEARVVDRVGALTKLLDEGDELAAHVVEHRARLGGGHALLVVVEEHVVELVGRVEAVDVAVLELDVLLEERDERGEIGLLARLDPRLVGVGAGAR